jgi:hypothetical protein
MPRAAAPNYFHSSSSLYVFGLAGVVGIDLTTFQGPYILGVIFFSQGHPH